MNAPRNLNDDAAWEKYVKFRINRRHEIQQRTMAGELRRGRQGDNLRKDWARAS